MDKDDSLIYGKVAAILNEREVVINIGSDQGVKKGMKFAILAATPEQIIDPDTGLVLDIVDRTKVFVQATEVREKIAICSTFRTTRTTGGALSTVYSFNRMFEASREIPETLRIQDSSRPKPLDPEESYVKRGDRVKQVESSPEIPQS